MNKNRPQNLDAIKEYLEESAYRVISGITVLKFIEYIEYLEEIKKEYDRDNGLDNC